MMMCGTYWRLLLPLAILSAGAGVLLGAWVVERILWFALLGGPFYWHVVFSYDKIITLMLVGVLFIVPGYLAYQSFIQMLSERGGDDAIR